LDAPNLPQKGQQKAEIADKVLLYRAVILPAHKAPKHETMDAPHRRAATRAAPFRQPFKGRMAPRRVVSQEDPSRIAAEYF
jgi:hypothetical protein